MCVSLGDHVCTFDTTFAKQRAHRLGIRYSVPWIEPLIKIGSHLADRVPKCGRCRFEETRSPSCHCELAARTDRMPERTNSCGHIGDEKNSKNADNCIELCIAKPQIQQVAHPKL